MQHKNKNRPVKVQVREKKFTEIQNLASSNKVMTSDFFERTSSFGCTDMGIAMLHSEVVKKRQGNDHHHLFLITPNFEITSNQINGT